MGGSRVVGSPRSDFDFIHAIRGGPRTARACSSCEHPGRLHIDSGHAAGRRFGARASRIGFTGPLAHLSGSGGTPGDGHRVARRTTHGRPHRAIGHQSAGTKSPPEESSASGHESPPRRAWEAVSIRSTTVRKMRGRVWCPVPCFARRAETLVHRLETGRAAEVGVARRNACSGPSGSGGLHADPSPSIRRHALI